MHVLVMGSGGVGGYYGGLLAQAGQQVTFVARGAHLEAMRERGLELRSGDQRTHINPIIAVASPGEVTSDVDLVLFTVKTYDADRAARALGKAIGPETAVLPLQNGVDAVDQLSAVLGPERVLAGTTIIVSAIAEPGVVVFMPPLRRISFGEPSGQITPRVERIAAAFEAAGIEAVISPNPQLAIWQKFIPLAPFATISSATHATVGEIREQPEGAALFRTLISEVVAVGRAEGIPLPDDAVDSAMRLVMIPPAAARNSMERDFERRRNVELEQLTGAVVRRGKERGVATPAFEALYAVLKIKAAAFGGAR